MPKQVQAAFAEMIGTFLLVFFGCGAILVDENLEGIFGLQGIALAFGFIVMAVVYTLDHISGAHINPAVTLALASVKKFPWRGVPLYWLAQFLGAILAALVLRQTLATGDTLGMTLPAGDIFISLFLEIIMTAFLMFVVMGTGLDDRASPQFAPLAIAAVVVVDVLVGGAISGASMNPARSFGPALITGNFEHLWIYFVGPVMGALIGTWLYTLLFLKQRSNLHRSL